MKKLLSIIIPVYKVEQYINKCLDSLLLPQEQLLKMEIIIVNDGTPDNSAIMAKKYADQYPDSFIYVDKENGGHGSVWNKGVELATGKYLRFLDSDDWLDNKNLGIFIDFLSSCNADLVFTHRKRVYENSQTSEIDYIKCNDYGKELLFDENECFLLNNSKEIANFWYCTYKTSLLKSVAPLFIHKIMYDDGILMVAPLLLSSSFICYDMILYNYLLGRQGQTMDVDVMNKHLSHRLAVQKSMIEFSNNHPTSSKVISSFVDSVLHTNIKTFTEQICRLPRKERKALMAEWFGFVLKNAKGQIDNTLLAKYQKFPCLFDLFVGSMNSLRKVKSCIKL